MEETKAETEKYVLDTPHEDLGVDLTDDQIVKVTYYDTTYDVPLGAIRYSVTWRNLIKDAGIEGLVATNPIAELTPDEAKPFFEAFLDLLQLYYKEPPEVDRHRFGGEDHEVLDTKLSRVDKEWSNYDKEFGQDDLDRIANVVQFADHLDAREVLNTCCQIAADKLMNKSEEELIKIFNLQPDQIPTEEERKLLQEKYAFLKVD